MLGSCYDLKCVFSGLPQQCVFWSFFGRSPTLTRRTGILELLHTDTRLEERHAAGFWSESSLTPIRAHTLTHTLDHRAPAASRTRGPRLVCFYQQIPFGKTIEKNF